MKCFLLRIAILAGLFIATLINFICAQGFTVKGIVTNAQTGEPLENVHVTVKDMLTGTVTNEAGHYSFIIKHPPPFTLAFSRVGYEKRELLINKQDSIAHIALEEQIILGQEVVVSASRFKESILQSPVSIEKLDLQEIRQTPALNFYESLSSLKGVDMNRMSLTFVTPNTRGFNGNTNFRINQMVDGVDNAPPALNFAAGNIFGLSPLDIESVELLVGASSALYGPGGINGTILMTSKNPFEYQGLSIMAKTGLMHVNADYRDTPTLMKDFSVRYAKAFKDKFAFKVNASYLDALDWHAVDFRDRTNPNDPDLNRHSNPGYDGINVYGDEVIVPVNLKDLAPQVAAGVAQAQGLMPGTPEFEAEVNRIVALFPDQVVTRTGYEEQDLVDYDTKTFRLNGSLHYRFSERLEAILQGGYGQGTSVYTAQNRFSLVNFNIFNAKAELKGPDFFLRAWAVGEGAGDTYDAGVTALRFNEAWKPSEIWYQDYLSAFTQSLLLGNSLNSSFSFARSVADNRDANGNILNPDLPALPLPGSQGYNTIFQSIATTPINEGGSLVVDKSKMYEFEGMYNFNKYIPYFNLLAGISHRIYRINSEGTTFFDTPGNPVTINQFGAYIQISRKFLEDMLKFTGSARYDKNENFDGRLTPRLSLVLLLDSEGTHTVRASLQTAFRFPPIADQLVDLDVGSFRVIGGIPEIHEKYNFDTNPVFPLTGTNPLVDEPVLDQGPFQIPRFRPERVTALELGYRGLYFKKRLLLDAYVFQNTLNGFLANQALVQNPNTPDELRFQTKISTDDPVSNYGWAIGADLQFNKGYNLGGNIAFNELESLGSRQAGLQSRFNTPEYRVNLSMSNRDVHKDIGFSINWRWQDEFLWESTFASGKVPSFSTLDAQISYKLNKLKSVIKIGGANIFNDYYRTSFGNPEIGAVYYISWTFDEMLN